MAKRFSRGGVGALRGNLIIGAAALMLAAGCGKETASSTREKPETQKRGEALVSLLDEHRKAKGSYPAKLDDLSAEARAKIQPPTIGDKKWDYSKSPDGEILLRAMSGGQALGTYNSQTRVWVGDGFVLPQ